MNKKWFPAVLLFVVVCALLPAAPSQSGNPSWVDDLIARFTAQPVGNPPQSVYSYDYKNQTVYYIPAQCCDQFSTLYDAEGKVMCNPDGGFTGRGDGRCTDFSKDRRNERLVWKDTRSRK